MWQRRLLRHQCKMVYYSIVCRLRVHLYQHFFQPDIGIELDDYPKSYFSFDSGRRRLLCSPYRLECSHSLFFVLQACTNSDYFCISFPCRPLRILRNLGHRTSNKRVPSTDYQTHRHRHCLCYFLRSLPQFLHSGHKAQ